jgi:hypothetical protein
MRRVFRRNGGRINFRGKGALITKDFLSAGRLVWNNSTVVCNYQACRTLCLLPMTKRSGYKSGTRR